MWLLFLWWNIYALECLVWFLSVFWDLLWASKQFKLTYDTHGLLLTFFSKEFNLLWPSEAIWHQRSWSTLGQVMACCLAAPSHHLTQCWLVINEVLEHPPVGNFLGCQSMNCIWEFHFWNHSLPPGDNELIIWPVLRYSGPWCLGMVWYQTYQLNQYLNCCGWTWYWFLYNFFYCLLLLVEIIPSILQDMVQNYDKPASSSFCICINWGTMPCHLCCLYRRSVVFSSSGIVVLQVCLSVSLSSHCNSFEEWMPVDLIIQMYCSDLHPMIGHQCCNYIMATRGICPLHVVNEVMNVCYSDAQMFHLMNVAFNVSCYF